MALKVMMVGTGGWGKTWCMSTLPKAVKEGLVEVVGAVDVNPGNLKNAGEYLGLSESQCFTDVRTAFSRVKAGACIIAAPPEYHEEVAILAMDHGCDVLSEKPIANSVASSLRILEKVKASGKKMGITMSHRFSRHIWTLRDLLHSDAYGKLDYIIFNFNWNRRDGLSARQANMTDTMFIEGAVHHLDLLEDLAGAKCESIYTHSWTPYWGNFKGGAQALMTMKFENAVRAGYETAWCNASSQNGWGREYIRAEFEKATIVLNRDKIECFTEERNQKSELSGIPIKLKENPKWSNDYLLDEFVNWVGGGKKMETDIESNFRSILLVFAAIESSRTGLPVKVDRFIEDNGIR